MNLHNNYWGLFVPVKLFIYYFKYCSGSFTIYPYMISSICINQCYQFGNLSKINNFCYKLFRLYFIYKLFRL